MDIYYVNGQYVDASNATVPANDLIVLRGFGIFDFMITYNRRPFHLTDHIHRFFRSASHIGLQIGLSGDEIEAIVEETIKRNSHHSESNIRLVYTGGVSSDGLTPENNGWLMVMVTPKHDLPAQWYSEGVKVITLETEKHIPSAKTTNYTTAVIAQQEAGKKDAVEVVYTNHHRQLLEGTTSNFFLVKSGRVITAGTNILSGITREIALSLMEKRFEVEIRDVSIDELEGADEAFITASNKEIVPVIAVDSLLIGQGKPGPVTRKLMRLFREYTDAYGRGEI